MSELTRRDLLISSLSLAAAGQPKCFNAHEYATLRRLADLILPGAQEAAGFIDFLAAANTELAAIFTGGLSWLDAQMQRRYQHDFLSAAPPQQTALLDLIAYQKNDSPEL